MDDFFITQEWQSKTSVLWCQSKRRGYPYVVRSSREGSEWTANQLWGMAAP